MKRYYHLFVKNWSVLREKLKISAQKIEKLWLDIRSRPSYISGVAWVKAKLNYHGPADFEPAAIKVVSGCSVLLVLFIIGGAWLFSGGSTAGEGDHHDNEHTSEPESDHERAHSDDHSESEDELRTAELDEHGFKYGAMTTGKVKATTIRSAIRLRGEISLDPAHSTLVSARFGGIVSDVRKGLGDQVNRGDVIAVIESATSRSRYPVTAAISGQMIDFTAVPGMFLTDNEAFAQIANLDNVIVNMVVPLGEFAKVAVGRDVEICHGQSSLCASTKVAYASKRMNEASQSAQVRVALDNKARSWIPGTFVEAIVYDEPQKVKSAVAIEAVQYIELKPFVFVHNNKNLHAYPVELGRQDDRMVEIESGLKKGQRYIRKNSFIAKAQLLKSSAAHEH